MDLLYRIVWLICIIFEAYIVCTALARRQISNYPVFFYYMLAVLTGDIALLLSYTRPTYAIKELLINALKIAISLWLMRRLLAEYVGLQLTLIGSYSVIIASLIVIALAQPLRSGGWWPAFIDLQNRIQVAIFLMFMVLAGCVYYYNLLIERPIKYILLGFLLYLSIFSLDYTIWLQFNLNDRARVITNYIDSAAYLASLLVWTRVYAKCPVRFFEPGQAAQPAWRKP